MRGLAAPLADDADDAGPLELVGIERRQLEADGDRAFPRARAGANFGQPEQHANESFTDRLEVGAARTEKWIGQGGERRPNALHRARDCPLRGQRFVRDHPPRLAFDLRAPEHQTLRFDQGLSVGASPIQVAQETRELLVSRAERRREVCQLRLAIGAQDPSLRHRDPGDQEVHRTDRQAPRRTGSLQNSPSYHSARGSMSASRCGAPA